MGGKKSRGILGAAIGVVAAIAIPFAAPVVAGALFGSSALGAVTAAGGLLGLGAGALSGSMTGNMGRGALIGGLGGAASGFVAGGGIGATRTALFGAPEAAGAATTAAAPTAAQVGALDPGFYGQTAPDFGTAFGAAPISAPAEPSFMQGLTSGFTGQPIGGAPASGIGSAAGATGTAAGGAAAGGAAASPSFFSAAGLGQAIGRVGAGLTSPAGLASVGQLAMTMYNKPPEGLTPQERAYVEETAAMAQSNRALFDERVAASRRLLQQGQANPEQAYAQASTGTQRRFREAGLRAEGDIRRGEIAGGEAGARAIPAEYSRAATATQAGVSAMPTTTPAGATTFALPAYRSAEERDLRYQADLARGVGGLAGSLFGTNSKRSLFG